MTAPWWRSAVVYQIYPRSFADGDGDGVGDLRGIAGRLEHVRDLGADAVWLSPIYRSPMADFGYDISDHTDVDPIFGTLADADALIARAHELGLRVLFDFVPNHTSDRHPWFEESRSDPRQRAPVLVRVAAGGRPAEQLGLVVRRAAPRLDARRAHRGVVPPLVPAGAARPQLGRAGGRGGDARSAALLAAARRRRLPDRRRPQDRQGPGAGRQRAGPPPRRGLALGASAPRRDPPGARGVRRRPRRGRRGVRPRPARARPLRGHRRRAPPGPQLLLPEPALVGDRLPCGGRRVRGPDARGRLAGLVSQQPRPFAHRHALRARARPSRRDARAHPARHAVPLPGRGAGADGRPRPRRADRRRRRSRPSAGAHAVGTPDAGRKRRRVQRRRAVAPRPPGRRAAGGGRAGRRPRFDARALPGADRSAARRARPSRGHPPLASTRRPTSSRSSASTMAGGSSWPSTSRRSRGRCRPRRPAGGCFCRLGTSRAAPSFGPTRAA